jgi:hypothetical protein
MIDRKDIKKRYGNFNCVFEWENRRAILAKVPKQPLYHLNEVTAPKRTELLIPVPGFGVEGKAISILQSWWGDDFDEG